MRPEGENGDTGADLQVKIQEALSQIFAEHNGSFIVKWVSIIEIMETDGERGVWSFTTPEAMNWDIKGLLQEVIDQQTGCTIARALEAHGFGGHD